MRLFFAIIYSFTTFFTLTWTTDPDLRLVVHPPGHVFAPGPPILVKKVDDSLNLTCRLVDKNHDTLPFYNISWTWQFSTDSNTNRVMVMSLSRNEANLVFESLKESDSGEYTCKCSELNLYENIRIKVKAVSKYKKYCNDKMFVCSTGHCIGRHYVCDGKPDCKFGIDEDYEHCGPNPCEGKIPCDDGRCIPASWCCDEERDPNCTTKVKPRCCLQAARDYPNVDSSTFPELQFNDMGFLQTTIYTVIGCAMAFMFIVTILVIAICRVHLKRNVVSRCPLHHQHVRTGSPLRPGLPLYDIDMFLDRHTHQESHSGGLLVTYNINNGVQFVGRPIDPPPYCEIIDAPPREGPPPPYVSRENLSRAPVDSSASTADDMTAGGSSHAPEGGDSDVSGGGNEIESENESVQVRMSHIPPDVVSNLKGLPKSKLLDPRSNLLFDSTASELAVVDLPKNHVASSLSDVSKVTEPTPAYTCSSAPSVSGLSKIKNKNIKKSVFTDFSDSESDSSCMENDSLLHGNAVRKNSEHIDDKSKNISDNPTDSCNSFINNIAAVSKTFIGSLSKKHPLENDLKVKTEKNKRVSPSGNNRKPFRPLLTQKSFDGTDRCRKDLVSNQSGGNFDKIVPTIAHSMGDLSPVGSEQTYEFSDRRDFLTLPLRESFIGVRNEEG